MPDACLHSDAHGRGAPRAASARATRGRRAPGPRGWGGLRGARGLAERPAVVLTTALRAMGLLVADGRGRLDLSDLAREHLVPGGALDVRAHVGAAAER